MWWKPLPEDADMNVPLVLMKQWWDSVFDDMTALALVLLVVSLECCSVSLKLVSLLEYLFAMWNSNKQVWWKAVLVKIVRRHYSFQKVCVINQINKKINIYCLYNYNIVLAMYVLSHISIFTIKCMLNS